MTTATLDLVEERLEVGADSHLAVSNVSGRISVQAVDESVITIRARKRGSRSAMENTRIEIRRDETGVRVETRPEDPSTFRHWRMSAVDYDITVPRDCRLDLHGVKSSISCVGSCAEVSIRTVTGDVDVSGIIGHCSISTVNGDIVGRELEGTLQTRTTNGGMKVVRSRLAGFDLHSTNGGFTAETPLTPGGTYRAETTNGSVRLFVPDGTGATVRMATTNGSTVTDLPAQITESSRRAWEGIINGGGAEVVLKTVNGSVKIGRSSSHLPPAAPSERPLAATQEGDQVAGAAAADDATTELLRALAEGEISVEDAMARLDEAPGEGER